MANMASNSDTLTSLPNDVFTVISSDFDLADLCSLRLTSHNLHALATTPHFQARFRHIRTDLTEDNLLSLKAVCSSPSLGHLIKKITVLAGYYDDKELQDQLKSGTRWEAQPVQAPFSHSVGHKLSAQEKDEVKAMIDMMVEMKEKQAAIQANDTEINLLAEALDHLGARAVSISLEAAVYNRPQGIRQTMQKCRDTKSMSQIMDHTFKVTVAALGKTKLQVSRFDIFNMQWGGYVAIKGLHDALITPNSAPDSGDQLEVRAALTGIQSLTINLSPAPVKQIGEEQLDPYDKHKYPVYGPEAEPELHNAYLLSLVMFLKPIGQSLRHLEIRFRGWHAIKLDCASIFAHLASADVPFSQLLTLHLHNIVIHNTDLIKLLNLTPALTHLGLHKVSLPHDPSHPKKQVNYPNSYPFGARMEPDVEGWKDGWKTVFDALIKPEQAAIDVGLTGSNDTVTPLQPCPQLEILEIESLHLTSFEHRIYFTSPHAALSRYVHGILDDEEQFNRDWFKIQAFQEGLACCTFTGKEVRGEDIKPNVRSDPTTAENDVLLLDDDARENYEYPVRNHLEIPLPPPPPASEPEPRGIQYKVYTALPYGSPAYYQWMHFWESREFSEKGCDPNVEVVKGVACDTGPVSAMMVQF